MKRTTLLAFGFWLLAFAAASAQTPMAPVPQPPRPAQPPSGQRPTTLTPPTAAPVAPGAPGTTVPVMATPPGPSRPESIPTQNVRVELTINDSTAPARKMVSILTADGRNGRVRSQRGNILLNVDAHPVVLKDSRIQLNLTLEYMPGAEATPGGGVNMINESLSVLLNDAKPTMISQSADPTSDRKVTVEVTASIVK